MEKQVTASGLEWTVLRASRFNNGVYTGRYIVSAEGEQTKASAGAMSRGGRGVHDARYRRTR